MANRTFLGRFLVVAALTLMLGGCSFSFSVGGDGASASAEELIEGDLADKLNMELTGAECDEPVSEEVGETFTCTADYQGQQMQLSTMIEADERIFVNPTNVVFPAQLEAIEASVADLLNDQADYGLKPDSLDCGSDPIIIEGASEFTCALTDPATSEIYDTKIEMTDIEQLVFNFEVAPDPR